MSCDCDTCRFAVWEYERDQFYFHSCEKGLYMAGEECEEYEGVEDDSV